MKRKLLHLWFLFVLVSLQAVAQDMTVSGRVSSSDDDSGLPGVSVQVKGSTRGATTDADGNYRISVPANARLIFSFIGFNTEDIAVGNRSTVNLTLSANTSVLNEVVVVGYGTQSKKTITGAVSSVAGEVIANKPVQSFDQALQGRAAGVNIITPNGVLNNAPVIRVRGVSSISGSSSPLIVIDGLPINSGNVSSGSFAVNNPLGDINPNDIESLEILKDAGATAIYGSRAAAGVILISTKKGKEGRAKVSYDGWVGSTQPFRLFDMLNAEQFMLIKNEAATNAGQPQQFFPTMNADGSIVNTNWYDYVYRTALQQNHNVNINGGNKDTRYAFSVGYTDQQGMIQKNQFSRITGRMNVSHRLNKAIQLGSNITIANSFNRSPNTGSISQVFSTGGLGRLPLVLAPNVAPYNPDGSYNINRASNNLGLGKNLVGPGGYYNPLPDLDLSKFTSENNHIIGNVFADVNLLKGLVFRTSYGLDRTTVEDIDFRNSIHGEGGTNGGQATNIFSNINLTNWQNYFTYNTSFGRHDLQAVIGTESQKFTYNSWGGARQGLSDPFFTSYQGNFTANNPPVGNFQTETGLMSYYGRLSYDYDKKYLLTLNYRRDGYSAYAPGNKWGNFFGGSAGWRISEESFWKNSAIGKVVNEFKLRASAGQVGNTGIGNFASFSLFNSGLYGTVPTFAFAQAGNPNLRWEISNNIDLGVAFGLFNDRITGELTYYQKKVNDLVLNEPQAPSRGIPGNSIATNVGAMENKGIELELTANVLTRGKFNWSTSFNMATLKNTVVALANNNADIFGVTGLETANIVRVGESIGSIFAIPTNGVNPANGRRVFVNAAGREVQFDFSAAPAQRWTYVTDGSIAPAIGGGDRVVAGVALPKWFGGFDNTFKYGDLELGVFLQYSGGNVIYNGTKAGLRDQRPWNNHTDMLNRWQNPGDVTNIPRPVLNDNVSNGSANPISENVEKGDFIRGRNLSLAYTFRNDLLRRASITSLRLYAQVQNAFVITNYTGADPEISTNGNTNVAPGVDRNSTPQARTYTFGIGLNF